MPINTWRGTCRYCGKKVGVRKGFAEKSKVTGHWLVWHEKCEPAAPAAPPVEHAPARTPYRDD
jgi:hypothetical protein